jgi:hypothetical protein
MARHDNTGRSHRAPQHVRLYEYMQASPAWQSLDCVERSLYVELARRYRGAGSNNGDIPYGVREAAKALGVGRATAGRALQILRERGFIRVGTASGFNMKGRVSTRWLLTEFPDDRVAGQAIGPKDFMKWVPPVSFNSPIPDRESPTSEPPLDLERDCVADVQRLWPSGGTVSNEITGPQSHVKASTKTTREGASLPSSS